MNLITAKNLVKNFGEKQILNNVDFSISDNDKLGLIGINGTGKSTLLKIISGVTVPDSGNIMKSNSLKIGYLPQNSDFDPDLTVIEQIFSDDTPLFKTIREYEKKLYENDTDEIIRLSSKLDTLDGWTIESSAKSILTKLGISNFNAKMGNLSGGQRKRVFLALALIFPCDLLILDEPTNHLDNETIDWLENYIMKRKGALILSTHDRYFLDRITNAICEIDKGSLYFYKGNYSAFLEKKLERETLLDANENKRQKLLKKELAWIKKGAKARSTKQKARIERFESLSSTPRRESDEKLEISFKGSRLGKKVIEINNIQKSFEGKNLFKDFSFIATKDSRVGIVGPNGCGKSTLMNLIYGKLTPDKGTIEIGETVKFGYYTQDTKIEDESKRAIEYIKEAAEYLTTSDGAKISAAEMLERFLFTSEMQWTPISKLSGGEKRRLYLIRILMQSPNVLLLDEPTNDLDIQTLTVLEDYLQTFGGAVIAVSHDRYFLDKICSQLLIIDKHEILHYSGNYSEYISSDFYKSLTNPGDTQSKKSKPQVKREHEKTLKLTFKEQKEFAEIDDVISNLENGISEKEDQISKSSTDYVLLEKLVKEKDELQKELDDKMERWVYLNEKVEKINNQ